MGETFIRCRRMTVEQRDAFKKDLLEWREERVAQFETRYFYVLPEPEVMPTEQIPVLVPIVMLMLVPVMALRVKLVLIAPIFSWWK